MNKPRFQMAHPRLQTAEAAETGPRSGTVGPDTLPSTHTEGTQSEHQARHPATVAATSQWRDRWGVLCEPGSPGTEKPGGQSIPSHHVRASVCPHFSLPAPLPSLAASLGKKEANAGRKSPASSSGLADIGEPRVEPATAWGNGPFPACGQ